MWLYSTIQYNSYCDSWERERTSETVCYLLELFRVRIVIESRSTLIIAWQQAFPCRRCRSSKWHSRPRTSATTRRTVERRRARTHRRRSIITIITMAHRSTTLLWTSTRSCQVAREVFSCHQRRRHRIWPPTRPTRPTTAQTPTSKVRFVHFYLYIVKI